MRRRGEYWIFAVGELTTTQRAARSAQVGIPLGVLVRAAALGRLDEPRQLAFLVTTLVLSLVFVLAARALVAFIYRKG